MQAVAREYRSTLCGQPECCTNCGKKRGRDYVSVVSCKNAMVITLKYITGLTS